MKNTQIVFGRLKELLGIKNDKNLSEFLNLKSVANYKTRDTLPYVEIIEKAELGKYHLDYIFLGVGAKAPADLKLRLSDDVNQFEELVESKKLAKMLCDLIRYGNDDLYKNIEGKLEEIKEISGR